MRGAGATHGVSHGCDREAGHAALDQEHAELPLRAQGWVAGEAENGEQIGLARVGDQVLEAVQDVGVTLAHRRAIAVQAGAAVRFGEAEADQQVAGRHGGQVARLLLRAAGFDQVHAAVVHMQHGPNAAVYLGQFL